jgi:hypothetical protein
MTIDAALNGLLKLAIAAAIVGGVALAAVVVLDRMATDQKAAERRALLQRNAELNMSAVAPGSVLACLDGGAGETVENACEKAVFANPQSTAGAVAYMAARLSLLADAQAFSKTGEPAIMDAFAGARRALELDRYGLAAHVLATRDGCTAEKCAIFAWLHDTAVVKANLKADAFDSYVSRYAAAWNKADPDKPAPVASASPPAPAEVASAPAATAGHTPLSSKYDFPSSASIPPVSIMNAEPPLPKAATDAQAAQPKSEQTKPEGAAAPAPAPVPPKRPQAQAAPAPAR